MRGRGRGPRKTRHGSIYPHEWLENYSPHSRGTPDYSSLRNLRLTSKDFCQAATRVLFRCAFVVWFQGLHKPASDGLRDTLLSNGLICSSIKKFVLDFGGAQRGFMNVQADDLVKHQLDSMSCAIESLPLVLKNLPGLEYLDVSISGQWCSARATTTIEGQIVPPKPLCVDIELIKVLTNNLAVSLNTSSLGHLTTLRLALPATYNFVEIEKLVSNRIWSNLKLLFLDITDATGPGGSKLHPSWTMDAAGGDEGYLPSNLQRIYPNAKHADIIFNIIGKCSNLETLGLWGTHILDGNLLEWKTSYRGLKSLYLKRTKFSAANLIKLLSPSQALPLSLSHLAKVWLSDVDLTSGTWSDVFDHLALCPAHWYLNAENLRYSYGGDSESLRSSEGRPWEDNSNLWSLHDMDLPSFKRLMRQRVRESGGRDNYPNQYYEQLIFS
jgi:hypothetical protein